MDNREVLKKNTEYLAQALDNYFDYAIETCRGVYKFEAYYDMPGICELTASNEVRGYPYPGSESLATATEPMKFGYWLTVYYSHQGSRTWVNVHQGNRFIKTYELVQY